MSNKKEQTAEKLQTEKLEVGSGYRVADGVSLTSSRGILAGCDIAAKDLGDNASFEALVKSGHIVKKMSIRLLAEKDLATVLEDAKFGFGWAITLTDPSGHSDESLVGQSNDISQVIDPETGQLVSGRAAHVTLRISSLTAAGFSDLPRSVSGNSLPWVVKFQDINGNDHTFRVRQSDPDRALGVVRLTLEAYAQ